jgi:hydroxyacylglutathione hydrolase
MRDDFVANVVRELEYSPGFGRPEEWNLRGALLLGALPTPTPLSPQEFAKKSQDAIVLDTQPISDFAAAHVPGAQSIWRDEVPLYAGWFLTFDRPILLVNETNDPSHVVRLLIRLGFDNLADYLAGGMLDWHKAGLPSKSIGLMSVHDLRQRLAQGEHLWILDVCNQEEVDDAPIPGAHHVHFTQISKHLDEVPKDRPVLIACATGLRSMTAASYSLREGWENLTVVLGGPAD